MDEQPEPTSVGLSRRTALAGAAGGMLSLALPPQKPKKTAPPPKGIPLPPIEAIALHRMAFGPRPGDVEAVRKLGFAKYVEEQLHAPLTDDPATAKRLQEATLHIEYGEETVNDDAGKPIKIPAVKEERHLVTLNQSTKELWSRLQNPKQPAPWAEKYRPVQDVQMATILRGVYSKWQLREVLVDFWHNHFNVSVEADHDACRVLWPIYDREVIRKHALGNFREFLEAVAKSGPMLVYLNNSTSKASPANENYARELFELHTLGADHYYNNLYHRWREVPGALEGKPKGYIDQDVYEAARAFTGWTIADGQYLQYPDRLPHTGEFHYAAQFHDPYQKRILGTDLDPNLPPLRDGERVLDLVAAHPGTATYVCRKLVKRFVADNPPEALVKRAAEAWIANREKPDQIARVMRVILLSPEFAGTYGEKVKRPLELMCAFLRATEAEVQPAQEYVYLLQNLGQRMFHYPFPTGHSDHRAYWVGLGNMVGRMNLPLTLMYPWFKKVQHPELLPVPKGANTARVVADFWCLRMLGYRPEGRLLEIATEFVQTGFGDKMPEPNSQPYKDRVRGLISLLAMTPEFQYR